VKTAYILAAALAAALAPACKWGDFDDLSDSAWVTATEKPDSASANWGVAIQRGKRSGDARLVVIGASEALYSEMNYTATGGVSVADGQLNLNNQFGIGNVDSQPILLADPATDEVALVTKSGSASIAVLRGVNGNITVHQVFGPERPDAATYMIAPGLDGAAAAQTSQTLVAQDDKVFGTFFTPPPGFQQVKCKLVDQTGATSVNVRALAAIRGLDPGNPAKATDDVVVWSATGKLFLYDGGVFDGARAGATPTVGPCPDLTPTDGDNTGTAKPLTGFDALDVGIAFAPAATSQILVVDNQFLILEGHDDVNDKGFLALYDLKNKKAVGAPHTEAHLRIADTFATATTRFVAAGYPNNIVDSTLAGQVLVYKVDTANGIAAAPDATLFDAQPESNQAFGRGVAIVPFNNKPIIAVAADNEVFTYFRLDPLYAETRQGR
jgi:hypothetical protein